MAIHCCQYHSMAGTQELKLPKRAAGLESDSQSYPLKILQFQKKMILQV